MEQTCKAFARLNKIRNSNLKSFAKPIYKHKGSTFS